MATKITFQYTDTISTNRKDLLNKVVRNSDLKKNDLRVFLHLFTHLDARTYREINKKNIAQDLGLNKSDVTEAIENLIDYDIIVEGSSQSVKDGYMFTF